MHISTKTALSFPKLMTIGFGPVGDELPYWAIQNAIGFSVDVRGNLSILAENGEWYRKYIMPHHVITPIETVIGMPFGKGRNLLEILPSCDGTWIVVGEQSAFNPHFREPSVLPGN